jgi:hypothetical protein
MLAASAVARLGACAPLLALLWAGVGWALGWW